MWSKGKTNLFQTWAVDGYRIYEWAGPYTSDPDAQMSSRSTAG